MENLRKRGASAATSGDSCDVKHEIACGERKHQQSTLEEFEDEASKRAEDERWVWRMCLAFRLLNALVVRTYFNPDEHWQALEIAHRMVFGYGHLTWEWKRGIRSYVHPLIFAALYKLLALTGLDTPWFMARAPRLFQALFVAVGDLYLFKLSFQLFGRKTAYWTLFCQMVNWFTFFCMVRTLSNSLETVLTIVALYYWPKDTESKVQRNSCWLSSRQLALTVAALSCVIRPTNGIIWMYMGVLHLLQTRDRLWFLVGEVFPIGVGCIGLASLLDRWMYGHWTIVPLNFLKFNFLSPGGDFYGTHAWHWYFSQGFPVMVFTFLPLSVLGVRWAKNRLFEGLICWVLVVYSLLGHKEFRFVLPILPWTMMFAGYALNILEQSQHRSTEDDVDKIKASPHLPETNDSKNGGNTISNATNWFRWIIVGLLATNVSTALYTSLIHQRGGERVMEYLAEEAYQSRVDSVLFLMPCHSTPFYSSLHKDVPMRFLDCSPSDEAGYVDEADRFKANPKGFLHTMFTNGESGSAPELPSHIVIYDSLEPQVRVFLEENHYKPDQKFFHAHFPVDRELQGHVLVFTL
ncbi:unnamed protein product [Calypogeia fissa]